MTSRRVVNARTEHKAEDRTFSIISCHRRRINTEEKANVVAAAWGTEFIQFLAALARTI